MYLLQIIEAMPHTDMVTEFLTKLGEFYEVVEEDPEKSPFKSLRKDKKRPEEQPLVAASFPAEKMNGDIHHISQGNEEKSKRELDLDTSSGLRWSCIQ